VVDAFRWVKSAAKRVRSACGVIHHVLHPEHKPISEDDEKRVWRLLVVAKLLSIWRGRLIQNPQARVRTHSQDRYVISSHLELGRRVLHAIEVENTDRAIGTRRKMTPPVGPDMSNLREGVDIVLKSGMHRSRVPRGIAAHVARY
jgi:hypothetical protein